MYSVSCLNKLKQSNSSSAYRYNNLTINSIASTVGISLTEDECLHVADEMYYKTKELAYMTKVILNRNKCDKLDIDDVRRSLQSIGGVELYGHDYIHAPKFLYIPEACVFVEEDPEILVPDSALDEAIYFQKRPPIIQASWVMPSNFSEEKAALEPPTRYFLTVARTIVNGIPDLVKVALEDLRTNPKVGAECAYFLNLVASIVKQQIVRGIHLTDNLIATVEAISINKYICVSPYMATNRVANALLKIVIEAPETNNDNDIILRIRAGTLLAKVIREWKIEFKQYMDTVKHLLEYLLDTNAPIQSQFGSVVTLTAFGELALITYVWPILEKYIMILAGRVYISRYFDPYTLHIMIAVFMLNAAIYMYEE
ncbi:hypothetical protein O3M35_004362 [Rhynocoris fuscipes]|uniref:TAF6 C-terminal HEAT repeat domain-containing protein n=1 Tax=Rhynocoris fuscipes TaxID=488301 RepID=A0AAW1CN52_9HEMI